MIITGYKSVDSYGTFTALECEHCGNQERLRYPNHIAHKKCYECKKDSFDKNGIHETANMCISDDNERSCDQHYCKTG